MPYTSQILPSLKHQSLSSSLDFQNTLFVIKHRCKIFTFKFLQVVTVDNIWVDSNPLGTIFLFHVQIALPFILNVACDIPDNFWASLTGFLELIDIFHDSIKPSNLLILNNLLLQIRRKLLWCLPKCIHIG